MLSRISFHQHLGVHPHLVELIRSFHEDMVATVRVADCPTDDVLVRNRLCQGGVMAPVLFNMYFTVVLGCFRE